LSATLKGIDKALSRVESVTDHLAAIAMVLTMVIVGGEVVSRYFLNAPLAWSYDVLTLYVLPALFFLGLPGSYARNAHIAVDILIQHLPPVLVAVTTLVGRVAGIVLFACLVYVGADLTIENYRAGNTFTGVIAFPVWPSSILIPVGCGLLLLRMLSQLPGDFLAIVRGGVRPAEPGAAEVFYE
jgi:TRAP-type C4-dicarboxylate transport system permease small subunit